MHDELRGISDILFHASSLLDALTVADGVSATDRAVLRYFRSAAAALSTAVSEHARTLPATLPASHEGPDPFGPAAQEHVRRLNGVQAADREPTFTGACPTIEEILAARPVPPHTLGDLDLIHDAGNLLFHARQYLDELARRQFGVECDVTHEEICQLRILNAALVRKAGRLPGPAAADDGPDPLGK